MTKTHLYGLAQKPNRKNGMVEISVRHPLSSIIKIATKSSCPEMISFTHGEKIIKTNKEKSEQNDGVASELNISKENIKKIENESETEVSSTTSSNRKESTSTTLNTQEATNSNIDYVIKGKDWFFVPDLAGEAASAVKMQILQIADLISQ